MFVSEYLNIDDDKLEQLGVFDSLINVDSNFYINIIRLKYSTTPEFKNAYERLNDFFKQFAMLLDAADQPSMKDVMYRAARKSVNFHEVNGINLGFSTSPYGNGWSDRLKDQFTLDSFQIIKKGSKQPELFHFVSLFEENVAGDRVSDMIASIIEPDIIKYTLRIMRELGIDSKSFGYLFTNNGLIKNPFKDSPILLLPSEILHELPVFRGWDNIDLVFSQNYAIKREINDEVLKEWEKWSSNKRKEYLRTHVFMNPGACERIIEVYNEKKLGPCHFETNSDYYAEFLFRKYKEEIKLVSNQTSPSSFDCSIELLNSFKDWVENNRGWSVLNDCPPRSREKTIQRLIHLSAKKYVDDNGFDISFEANSGNGQLDVKLSDGNDKTVIEVKLSTSNQYLHGYQTQIREYAKAEKTDKMIYIYFDFGHPKKLEKLKSIYESEKDSANRPLLIIVDSMKKESASQIITE